MINIAYVNEIADACKLHNIVPTEVFAASATKPFGFMGFQSGLGIGGHCIPVNPAFLFTNNNLPLLALATESTRQRPANKAAMFAKQHTGRILVVGVAFKPGQSLTDNSPSLAFATALKDTNEVYLYDPLVDRSRLASFDILYDEEFTKEVIEDQFEVVFVGMHQRGIDWSVLDNLVGVEVVYANDF